MLSSCSSAPTRPRATSGPDCREACCESSRVPERLASVAGWLRDLDVDLDVEAMADALWLAGIRFEGEPLAPTGEPSEGPPSPRADADAPEALSSSDAGPAAPAPA